MHRKTLLFLLLLLCAVSAPAFERGGVATTMEEETTAAETTESETNDKNASDNATDPFAAVVDDETVSYIIKTGLTPIVDGKGDVQARIFSTSYILRDGARERPVMFLFNGGPGSASMYLHSGSFAPVYFPGTDRGLAAPEPPFAFQPNPHSLIDAADLVFIDPVGTGYSRVEENKGEDKEKAVPPDAFWDVNRDIESMVEFIRGWLFANDRWGAEVYLAGESYGGLRAAGMAAELAEIGVAPSGILLISPAIAYQDISTGVDNDVTPYVNALPGMTATAHYHKRLGSELQALPEEEAVARAIRWSWERFAPALRAGNRLSAEERRTIVRELAAFTGMPEVEIEAWNLRIDVSDFSAYLLRDAGRFTGLYDSRLTAPGYDWMMPEDPIHTIAGESYKTAFMRFLTETMGIKPMQPYEYSSDDAFSAWDFTLGYKGRAGLISMGESLARTMRRLPFVRVFLASGRYDLVTPPESALQSLSRMRVPADRLEKNLTVRYYEGGHMMYTNPEAHAALSGDVRAWIGGK